TAGRTALKGAQDAIAGQSRCAVRTDFLFHERSGDAAQRGMYRAGWGGKAAVDQGKVCSGKASGSMPGRKPGSSGLILGEDHEPRGIFIQTADDAGDDPFVLFIKVGCKRID